MKKLLMILPFVGMVAACNPSMTPEQVASATKACLDAGMYAMPHNETSTINGVSSISCKPFPGR